MPEDDMQAHDGVTEPRDGFCPRQPVGDEAAAARAADMRRKADADERSLQAARCLRSRPRRTACGGESRSRVASIRWFRGSPGSAGSSDARPSTDADAGGDGRSTFVQGRVASPCHVPDDDEPDVGAGGRGVEGAIVTALEALGGWRPAPGRQRPPGRPGGLPAPVGVRCPDAGGRFGVAGFAGRHRIQLRGGRPSPAPGRFGGVSWDDQPRSSGAAARDSGPRSAASIFSTR